MTRPAYVHRLAENRLSELLADLPAVMVTGPRAAGKTTTVRCIAAGSCAWTTPHWPRWWPPTRTPRFAGNPNSS